MVGWGYNSSHAYEPFAVPDPEPDARELQAAVQGGNLIRALLDQAPPAAVQHPFRNLRAHFGQDLRQAFYERAMIYRGRLLNICLWTMMWVPDGALADAIVRGTRTYLCCADAPRDSHTCVDVLDAGVAALHGVRPAPHHEPIS